MSRWLLSGALALALPAPAVAELGPEETAAARFLERSGHRLAAAEPTATDMAPMVSRLAGARVIGLGEVTHGTHEDVAFKALLFRELVKAGAVDTLAIEANRIVGVGFDRFVREGAGDPAALILSPSAFKIFKNDEFAAVLLWLRAWNLAHPDAMIGVIAIDDQDGAVDANFALGVLARHDPATAQRLRQSFGTMLPAPGAPRIRPSDWIAEHGTADVARVLAAAAELRDTFAAHATDWRADPDYSEAAYAARLVWQNVRIFELDVKGADLKDHSGEYWSRRDRFMADNLLERLGDGRRAVLWAHDDHVMHTYTAEWIKLGATGLGVEVRRRLGVAYRTLGFTYTRATVTATRGTNIDLKQLVGKQHDVAIPLDNNSPHSTGRVLAALPGDVWWFDAAATGADRMRGDGSRSRCGTAAWDGSSILPNSRRGMLPRNPVLS
ncbi:erythromycin esterase family protein [Sphingomonas sp. 1P08PE]|uniref:erythromycin esterase family protein n=1 Tax=Sphingomonas sp. 1P08PE TaxID=554122 RepID=UPI0039A18908